MSLPRATEQDRSLLQKILGPAEERYETPAQLRGRLLAKVWDWQRRTGASDEDTNRVIDSLGLHGDEVHRFALSFDVTGV
jgi:hypothetical protein